MCGDASLTKDRSGRNSRNDSGATRKLRTAGTHVEQRKPFGSARTTSVVHWRGNGSSVGQLWVCRFFLGGQCARIARKDFLRGGSVLSGTRPYGQCPIGLESHCLNGGVRPGPAGRIGHCDRPQWVGSGCPVAAVRKTVGTLRLWGHCSDPPLYFQSAGPWFESRSGSHPNQALGPPLGAASCVSGGDRRMRSPRVPIGAAAGGVPARGTRRLCAWRIRVDEPDLLLKLAGGPPERWFLRGTPRTSHLRRGSLTSRQERNSSA